MLNYFWMKIKILIFIDDVNKEIINLIIYDMKNFIGLEISEYDMLNIISSQPRR